MTKQIKLSTGSPFDEIEGLQMNFQHTSIEKRSSTIDIVYDTLQTISMKNETPTPFEITLQFIDGDKKPIGILV